MAITTSVQYVEFPTNDPYWKARIKCESSTDDIAWQTTASFTLEVYRNVPSSDSNTATYHVSFKSGVIYYYGGIAIVPVEETRETRETVDGGVWTEIVSFNTYIRSHLSNGSCPSYFFEGSFNATNGVEATFNKDSGIFTFPTLFNKAIITSAPNFTDTQNPTIKYSNPMGDGVSALEACIADSKGNTVYVPYRDISKTGSSYTFNLTSKERQTLINAVGSGTSMTVRFYVRTKGINDTDWSFISKTFSLTDAMPDLAPAVVDMNETTIALTGDMTKLVKYYSQAACSTNGTVKQGATIKSQKVVNGAITKTNTTGVFAIPNVESGEFEFSITDSRNNTTTATITRTLIEYVKLTCNQSVQMGLVSEQGTRAEITITGNYFNNTFGAVKNELLLEVRHKEQNGEYGPWVNELTDGITLSDAIVFDGNTYSLTFGISELQYDKTYVFQARVTDKLSSITTDEYTIKLLPVFDWSGNDFNFNVPVSFQGEEMADFVIAQGTEAMGTNGTWYWSKWKSGKAECYGVRNYGNMAINVAFGSMYGSADFTQALPSGLFMAAPDYIGITPMSGGYGTWVNSGYGTEATASATGTFQLVRPNSKTLSQAKISFHVIGRWK